MTKVEIEFYNAVRAVIQREPQMHRVAMAALTDGMLHVVDQARHDSSEWETVAMNAMHTRLFKNNRGWLADKIAGLNGRASMRWDDIIERLKVKA
jgi:hypothetical protein